jgi:beta-1,4-mannosyl-glycoprotein beta-1,4-N-acetylglucosaminyltransferase
MGGTDRVIFKIESGGHQELNTDHIKSNVGNNMDNKNDIFFRGCTMQEVEIDQSYPTWLIENIHKFPQLLNNKI